MGSFYRRTLTAVWIVIFILGGFWLHPISFFITGLIIICGAQYEYYSLIKKSGIEVQMLTGLITGTLIYILSTLIAAEVLPNKFFLTIIPFLILILIIELYLRRQNPFDSLAHTFFGIAYIAVPFSFIPFSAFSRTGLESILGHGNLVFSPGILIGFLFLLWAHDTGAYLAGITIGRHRLMERISPKKSWEGFFGGLIISVVTAWFLSGWLGVVDKKGWVIIAIIIAVGGTYGDLVESMLKRSTGVKDSGTVMPGHGGFLDRFDSALVSFPLVYLFIALFG